MSDDQENNPRQLEFRWSFDKARQLANPIGPLSPGALSILIVEDDPMMGSLLVDVLADAGHDAEHVASGERAVTRLAQTRFDVLISDLDLPGVDGFTVMKYARQYRPATLIVAMTGGHVGGFTGETLDRRVTAVGANALLLKPFPSEALRAILAEAQNPAAQNPAVQSGRRAA